MEPLRFILIGAGNRGRGIFGRYALDFPHKAKFVAVVEPDEQKRHMFARQHNIPSAMCFNHYKDLYQQKKIADAVIIATLENERLMPILGAIEKEYHILVEKPLGTRLEEIIHITDAAANYGGVFAVCHQMRYTPLYQTVKSMIDSGNYGKIVSIQHSENVSFSHMAHSFVRGFFNSSTLTPMILAKCCHDMDILRWLAGARPSKIASFGNLTHFKPENAPSNAPARCLDGCPAERDCPYSVFKLYLAENPDPAYIRQMGVIHSKEELRDALKINPFGRCVYHCDNDVVDHQVVQIVFGNNVTANFSLCGHNAVERRMTKISLDRGEIEIDTNTGSIHAWTFSPEVHQVLTPNGTEGTHGGGDQAIMEGFIDAVNSNNPGGILTSVGMSLDSHLMAFAAEESRRTGNIVDMMNYEQHSRTT